MVQVMKDLTWIKGLQQGLCNRWAHNMPMPLVKDIRHGIRSWGFGRVHLLESHIDLLYHEVTGYLHIHIIGNSSTHCQKKLHGPFNRICRKHRPKIVHNMNVKLIPFHQFSCLIFYDDQTVSFSSIWGLSMKIFEFLSPSFNHNILDICFHIFSSLFSHTWTSFLVWASLSTLVWFGLIFGTIFNCKLASIRHIWTLPKLNMFHCLRCDPHLSSICMISLTEPPPLAKCQTCSMMLWHSFPTHITSNWKGLGLCFKFLVPMVSNQLGQWSKYAAHSWFTQPLEYKKHQWELIRKWLNL